MACVRYWAAARELAGSRAEAVDGPTLAAVLAAVGARHGTQMQRLIERSVLLVDGTRTARDADVAVTMNSQVEILPPYAGGSA